MDDLINILISIINENKIKIAKAYINFYGEKYKNHIINNVMRSQVFFYHDNVDKDVLERMYKHLCNNPKLVKRDELFSAYATTINNLNELKNIYNEYVSLLEERYSNFNEESLKDGSSEEFDLKIREIVNRKRYLTRQFQNNSEQINKALKIKESNHSFKNKEKSTVYLLRKNFNDTDLVCIFNLDVFLNEAENIVFHEFGHIAVQNGDKIGLCFSNGFRYLNEALTEAIAKKVCKNFRMRNNYIFNPKGGGIVRSCYEKFIQVAECFIKKFNGMIPEIMFSNEKDLYKLLNRSFLVDLENICYNIYINKKMKIDEREKLIKKAEELINNYRLEVR